MSKGFITGTNEELIKAYKESRDESYLKDLIEANKGLINLLVSPYLTSIPNSELEDLTSESYLRVVKLLQLWILSLISKRNTKISTVYIWMQKIR